MFCRDLSVDTVELMKYLNRNKTEAGTHEELMKAKGHYHSLVLAQISKEEREDEEREQEDTVNELAGDSMQV